MEFNWKTNDGLNIFGNEWKVDNPKAVIALVHGFGEHCMRYDSMAKYYNKNGYAMVGYDRRGHGQSDGPRGYTDSYEAYLDEVDQLIIECTERYPGKPVIIYGHSMGGNIVLNYLIQRPKLEHKLTVVTGPWIRLVKEPPGLVKSIVGLLRKVIPRVGQDNKIGKYISRVPEEVDKYMNDPLNHGKMTINLAYEMIQWSRALQEFDGTFKTPMLIMHAGDDQLTDPKATTAFVERVSGDIDFKIWKGLYHEIHNERIREQVYDYTIEWLDRKGNFT